MLDSQMRVAHHFLTSRRISCQSVAKRTDEEASVTIINSTVLLQRADYLALLMKDAEAVCK